MTKRNTNVLYARCSMHGIPWLDIINFCIGGVGFAAVIFAFGELFLPGKKVTHYVSFVLYFVWGQMIYIDCINRTPELFARYPYFAYANNVLELFIGPAIYHYFRALLTPNVPFGRKSLLLYLPGAVSFFFYLPLFLKSADFKRAHYPAANLGDVQFHWYYSFVSHYMELWVIFCLGLFLYRFHIIFWGGGKAKINPIASRQRRGLIVYFLIFTAAMALNMYFRSTGSAIFQQRLSMLMVCIMSVPPLFVRYRHTAYLSAVRNELSELSYKKSRLKGIDVKAVLMRLTDLMTEEKIYSNEKLTLKDFSAMVELSTHQLSEILNAELGLSFRQHVNAYRVAAAKDMLLQGNANILSVAFKCGFNSKTTFNTVFSSATGLTPTEWREKHGKAAASKHEAGIG